MIFQNNSILTLSKVCDPNYYIAIKPELSINSLILMCSYGYIYDISAIFHKKNYFIVNVITPQNVSFLNIIPDSVINAGSSHWYYVLLQRSTAWYYLHSSNEMPIYIEWRLDSCGNVVIEVMCSECNITSIVSISDSYQYYMHYHEITQSEIIALRELKNAGCTHTSNQIQMLSEDKNPVRESILKFSVESKDKLILTDFTNVI